MGRVTYNFEYKEKLKTGFIGCGGHAWRNIYPAFQYAPVNLVSVCDLRRRQAETYAKQFGADRVYESHREMLESEDLDAVFVVTNYDEQGHPTATRLAREALEAGCHVWMEKPPAANVEEVESLMAIQQRVDKVVLVGYKKMFFPAIVKAREIMDRSDFGRPSSVYIRYPQSLPAEEDRRDDRKMVGFLDHLVHPASILIYLMGSINSLFYRREGRNGGTVTALTFENGAVGTMHLTAGQSDTSPLERLEIVGEGANLVVDNGVNITYYRPGGRGEYGRSSTFVTRDEEAPLHWEPEFSLGQLYNKNLFALGYVPEIQYFCDCVLSGRQPVKAGLEDALELMRLYQAYRGAEEEEIDLRRIRDEQETGV